MGFLTTTTTNSTSFDPQGLAALQGAGYTQGYSLSSQAASGISQTFGSNLPTLPSLSSIASTPPVLTGFSAIQQDIASSIAAVNNTFVGGANSLANGISSAIGSLFGNTSVKTASTVTTNISDPTAVNVTAAKSTSFKLNSLEVGSQAITNSGANSTNGSLANLMNGTSLSTVLDRYNLSSPSTINTTVGNATSGNILGGLFTNLNTFQNYVGSTANLVHNANAAVNNIEGTVSYDISNTVVGVRNTTASLIQAVIAQPLNDVAMLKANVGQLSNSLGGISLVGNFSPTGPMNNTLLDSTGAVVNTNNSNVDSVSANSILGLGSMAGCNMNTPPYSSYMNSASLLNLGLITAAIAGLTDMVDCLASGANSIIHTPLGQQAMSSAFVNVAPTQPTASALILNGIQSPASVYSPAVAQSIISNQNLTQNDLATVNGMMSSLGTSSLNTMTIPSTIGNRYPIIDTSIAANTNPIVVNSSTSDQTITDYLNGFGFSTQSDGTLALAA